MKRLLSVLFGERGSGRVVVNNVPYSGERVDLDAKGVWVDGRQVSGPLTGPVTVQVQGDVARLETDSGDVAVEGNVQDLNTTSGDVSCQDVAGDVHTVSGDIRCSHIGGNVHTVSGDILR